MPEFPPPQKFDFRRPTLWPEWKRRFHRCKIATKLSDEPGEVQVAALVYTMGTEAEHIFEIFKFDSTQSEKEDNLDTVLARFEGYLNPKRNTLHEQARLQQRVQKQGESVEEFVRRLFEIAEHCGYETKKEKEDNIKVRVVVGLLDKSFLEITTGRKANPG